MKCDNTVIKELEKFVEPILEKFPDFDWCLAGGAPRDWQFGEKPKDYDIFFFIPNKDFLEIEREIEAEKLSAFFLSQNFQMLGSEDYQGVADLKAVYESSLPNVGVIQCMVTINTSVEEVLNAFDIDICQIAWYKEDLIQTPAFSKAFSSKTAAIIKASENYSDSSIYRLERISRKLGLKTITVSDPLKDFAFKYWNQTTTSATTI